MRMASGITIDAHGASDIGKVRTVNEDQFLVAALHKVVEVRQTSLPAAACQRFESGARALLLLVADGVGGASRGDEASSLALDTIVSYVTNSMRCFYKLDDRVQQDLLAELATVVQQSNTMVRAQAAREGEHVRMATTLTMAHVLWPRAYVVQIGDSRCYHLRGSVLRLVTRDQTYAQELLDRGALTPEEAEQSPLSQVLTRAIGGEAADLQPEIGQVDLEPGDSLVLCTDGLTKHVPDVAIPMVVAGADSAEAACRALVGAALAGGGSDNVTVVVCRFQP
jgi:protein phosphatase